jgi:tetratricopeptide (TPR) repeat protein
MLRLALNSVLLIVLLGSPAWPAQQQPAQQKQPEAQDQQTEQRSPQSSPQSQQESSASKYDPFPAEQDVEVGTFYMHKGDLDAAIGRFEDAIRLRSNFAKPRLLLAEAYEKKGDKATAVKYYKEYLKILPDAPEAKKVRQKIEKLTPR